MLQWSGKSDPWNASSPGGGSGRHGTVADCTDDSGVSAAYHGVHVSSGWAGTVPNEDAISPSSTFPRLRSCCGNDPAWSTVGAHLKARAVPVLTHHPYWAQADIALAMGSYAELFG